MWNICHYELQFNFKKAHIAGLVNIAADFLFRLEPKVTEKIRLQFREDVQTTPFEVTTFSSNVAEEGQLFFRQKDAEDETETKTLAKKAVPEKGGRMG